jgi:2-oxoglutarate dehydrogenase E2 component (dihydrolipoamide succinyltransferase)
MAIEVKMPQLGESVHEGTIGKWLKQPGEAVAKYEPLLEVVTDKVDTEITAADTGVLLQILVAEGETVQVGTVLALLGAEGEAVESGATQATATSPSAAAASVAPATGSSPKQAAPAGTAATGSGTTTAAANSASSAAAAARVSPVAARMAAKHGIDATRLTGTGRGGAVTRQDVERFLAEPGISGEPATAPASIGFISPRVARLAAEHGVDLRAVTGTGKGGRITARDVEAFVAALAAAPESVPTAAPSAAPTAAPSAAPTAAPVAGSPAPAGTPAGAGPRPGELVELSTMRKSIAEHMVRSKQTSPHVTTVHEVDMSAVVAAYRALKDAYADRGVKLTYTAFIVQVVAEALAEHRLVNSSWTDQGVQVHPSINIGMAVAIPTGLIVPVIRNADEKSLQGIARDVTDLASRARNKQLVPDDVQGGTFTITNYGTLGSLIGTPVINQPQAAILGTGAIRKIPVVIESPEGDSIGIRPMMFLSLTFDHRILDGGTADPFVQTIVRKLEHYALP